MATPGWRRAQTRSGLAICEPAIPELRAHVLRSGLPPTSTATLSATGPWMTLRPVNNPAAGAAQRTRTGRHFSGMTRRDLAFVHLHRPIKAAYLACRLLDLRNGFASDSGHNQHSHSVHMFRMRWSHPPCRNIMVKKGTKFTAARWLSPDAKASE